MGNFIFFEFFEVFTKDVLKSLLRGAKTFERKYTIVFEKYPKNTLFWVEKFSEKKLFEIFWIILDFSKILRFSQTMS